MNSFQHVFGCKYAETIKHSPFSNMILLSRFLLHSSIRSYYPCIYLKKKNKTEKGVASVYLSLRLGSCQICNREDSCHYIDHCRMWSKVLAWARLSSGCSCWEWRGSRSGGQRGKVEDSGAVYNHSGGEKWKLPQKEAWIPAPVPLPREALKSNYKVLIGVSDIFLLNLIPSFWEWWACQDKVSFSHNFIGYRFRGFRFISLGISHYIFRFGTEMENLPFYSTSLVV